MPCGLSFVSEEDQDSNGGVADTMAFSLFMVGQTESFVSVHRRARPFWSGARILRTEAATGG